MYYQILLYLLRESPYEKSCTYFAAECVFSHSGPRKTLIAAQGRAILQMHIRHVVKLLNPAHIHFFYMRMRINE